MISTQLLKDLIPHLKEAEEIWVAVALIKEDAYDKLQELINPLSIQHYLVGIDLPTSPQVLKKLKQKIDKNVKARICKPGKTFHPKVYLIKKQNEYIAFVGSGNLTPGGLEDNIEMNFLIEDQKQCERLLEWFKNLFKDAYPLIDENIQAYEKQFSEIETASQTLKFARQKIKLKKPSEVTGTFNGIDFSDRYFKKEHHYAFRKSLWEDHSTDANNERYKTYQKFYELHDAIFPHFLQHHIFDLHPHSKKEFIVSHYYHVEGYTSRQLSAMWLSYGKSKDEIIEYQKLFPAINSKEKDSERDGQSFINHARLQVRIELMEIGIWLLFAKNNKGSLFDRQYFKEQMREVDYRLKFFSLTNNLPERYYMSLGLKKTYCSEFINSDDLYDFCKHDNGIDHFIIGIDYKIEEPEMSERHLPETVLSEFERLYLLYEFMRDKQYKK